MEISARTRQQALTLQTRLHLGHHMNLGCMKHMGSQGSSRLWQGVGASIMQPIVAVEHVQHSSCGAQGRATPHVLAALILARVDDV